jgi:hypothetical protein
MKLRRHISLLAAVALLIAAIAGIFPVGAGVAKSTAHGFDPLTVTLNLKDIHLEPSVLEISTAAELDELLPAVDELDGSWMVQNEGERTREEVIELLGDQGDELIETLEWEANAFRNFERTNITDPDSFYEPTQLTVSIHAFADSERAADALQPLSEWVAEIDSMESDQIDSSADNALAYSGLDGRLPAFVLYVQEGNLVIRVGAISMLGDPRDAVIEVSELVLEKTKA